MHLTDMSIRRHSLLPLTSGLMTAQVIATLFVWQSNLHLHHSHQAMQAAGWWAIPTGAATESLTTFGAAFWGGLFYTLSVGVGFALATWAALYLWRWAFRGDPRVALLLVAAWLILIAATIIQGALYPILFVVCVPLVTAAAALQKPSAATPGRYPRRWIVSLATLVLLTAFWGTQFNAQMFSTIRDHLLLSNPIGIKVNDFYYRNTLYAAEAFKSFRQKTLVTWRLETDVSRTPAARRLAQVLAGYDVLETPGFAQSDLIVHPSQGHFVFTLNGAAPLEVEPAAFYADPGRWLQKLSQEGDRYGTFRKLTLAGLLLGFPILLYVGVQGAVLRGYALILPASRATWATAATCLFIGLLLLIPVAAGRTEAIPVHALGEALAGDDRHQRVAALRRIEQERLDITQFDQHRALFNSPWVAERYWLARALAFSRDADSYTKLLSLIHDPHPNVVCQAFYALGRRGDSAAIAPIKDRLVQSDHWYLQWYGYQAMRGLGWRQTRSRSAF